VLKVDQTKMEDSAFLISQRVEELAAATPGFESLSKHVQVSVTDYGLLIQIFDGGDEFLFDRSSAELKPGLVALLEQLAPILTTLDNPLQLHGHTDARPFPEGSDRTNWSLSFDRADRARAVLEGAGLREGQVSGVFAHGAMAPLVPDPNAPENRRLSILAVRRGLENKPPDPGTPDIL
jgi:chemotaxis protein MotB